jgi:hypothetical protein
LPAVVTQTIGDMAAPRINRIEHDRDDGVTIVRIQ